MFELIHVLLHPWLQWVYIVAMLVLLVRWHCRR